MTELDFTIEFDSEQLGEREQAALFAEADQRLRALAKGHSDLIGAAINVRRPAKSETAFLFEVTVVVYARPTHIASSQKGSDPLLTLKDVLSAVERQVREKREKLAERWKEPGNDPVEQEILEVRLAERGETQNRAD